MAFAWLGRTVEVRGTASAVVILGDGAELARHARHTRGRLLLDPAHYDGPATATVLAPTPLGARARAPLAAGYAALPAPAAMTRAFGCYVTLLERVTR